MKKKDKVCVYKQTDCRDFVRNHLGDKVKEFV